MKVLVDTQAFLWFMAGDRRMGKKARGVMDDDRSNCLLSAASVWEMAIKAGLGRLDLPGTVEEYVAEKMASGFTILPVEWTHAAAVERLPSHHRDPFDRLIVAQAIRERLPILTGDKMFKAYGVEVIW